MKNRQLLNTEIGYNKKFKTLSRKCYFAWDMIIRNDNKSIWWSKIGKF